MLTFMCLHWRFQVLTYTLKIYNLSGTMFKKKKFEKNNIFLQCMGDTL